MLATRERECIFIPLKIAKRKRYKNAVDGIVLAAIQIAEDPIQLKWERQIPASHLMHQVHVSRWNQSYVSVHVRSVRAASYHNAAE